MSFVHTEALLIIDLDNTVWCNQMGTVFRRCRLRQFNMSYKDEDSILDQKYEKQIFYEDFKFLTGLKKM